MTMVDKTQVETEETASSNQSDSQQESEALNEATPKEVETEETQAEETEETVVSPSEPETEEPQEVASEPTVEEQLDVAKQQVKDWQDRYLRLNAEFENYKKRMAKENTEKLKYYHIGLIKELLPALDSMEQAIEHGQKENATIAAMLEGIEMVYKLNQEALEKFSVSKVKAIGEPFDPTVHQAVGTVASDTIPEDHVVDQFQVGYLLHDRVIRPAMVRVSKKQ